jgi:high-affinity iron transporter
VAHGVHELQEAKGIPTVIENIWDVNPPVNLDGSYPILHEKGHVGSILKSLFGYNGNPSLIEGLSYLLYITLVIGLWRNIEKSKNGFIKKHRQNIPLFQ